jgi:hypothetical protein
MPRGSPAPLHYDYDAVLEPVSACLKQSLIQSLMTQVQAESAKHSGLEFADGTISPSVSFQQCLLSGARWGIFVVL